MSGNIDHRLVTRIYYLTYLLLGIVVGVRYGIDVWMLLAFGGKSSKFLLMALSVLGMLAGELLGAWLSDQKSPTGALLSAVFAYFCWSVALLIALTYASIAPILAGALIFGLALGMQHSTLDAWLEKKSILIARRSATISEFQWGYSAYTAGHLVGIAGAFPLLYGLDLQKTIIGPSNEPLPLQLFPWPYVAALAFCLVNAIILVSFWKRQKQQPTFGFIEQCGKPHFDEVVAYRHLLSNGGVAFLMLLLIGASISFIIQNIDTFGALDLLTTKATVSGKAEGLAILHGSTAIAVFANALIIYRSGDSRAGQPAVKTLYLFTCLGVVLALLIIAGRIGALSESSPAIALGLANSIVNMLPQSIKRLVLDFSGQDSKGAVSALLGLAKRIPNLCLSLALWISGLSALIKPATLSLLIASSMGALCCLGVYHFLQYRNGNMKT